MDFDILFCYSFIYGEDEKLIFIFLEDFIFLRKFRIYKNFLEEIILVLILI